MRGTQLETNFNLEWISSCCSNSLIVFGHDLVNRRWKCRSNVALDGIPFAGIFPITQRSKNARATMSRHWGTCSSVHKEWPFSIVSLGSLIHSPGEWLEYKTAWNFQCWKNGVMWRPMPSWSYGSGVPVRKSNAIVTSMMEAMIPAFSNSPS